MTVRTLLSCVLFLCLLSIASAQAPHWTFEADGPIYSSPTLHVEEIYVGSGDGHLYALDVNTGAERWRFGTGGAVDSAPAVADGVVHVVSRDGRLYAVDAARGTLRWSYATEGEQMLDFWDFHLSDPLVYDDMVIFGSGDGAIYALERSTGAIAWTLPVFTRVFGTAVTVGGEVVFGGFNGKLMAVDPESGDVRWTYQTPASRALFDTVYDAEGGLTDEMQEMYGDGRRREAEMRLLTLGSIPATPAVHGRMVYFGTTEGVLHALDADAPGGPE